MKYTTADITKRMAGGDTNALAVFYDQWFTMMYTETQRLTKRDESFCLDIVQDAMMRIIKRMTPMKNDAQVATWLRTVIRSCVSDRLRSEHARLRREQTRHTSPASSSPKAQIDSDQLLWLQQEIDQLDESLRRPLLLRIISGRTLAQIGAALGLTTGAVDGRITRALTTLRRSAANTGEIIDD